MEDDRGVFNIEISSSDDATDPLKPSRDHQSEENFSQQKASWKPKVENGEIWRSLSLPIKNPSKPQSQTILHAIEELYFLKFYVTAERLTTKALEGQLQDDFRAILKNYHARCRAKLAK